MPTNAVAENVLGTIGTVLWTGQIIPQIWKSWREKSTEGLSHWLMFTWGAASVFMGVFNVTQDINIPLMIQPQLFGFLSIVSWSQCLFYGHRKSLIVTACLLMGTLLIFGGFEAGMIYAIRPATKNGNSHPATIFGIITSVLLAVGLLPQYAEIYRLQEVKGISMVFMTIDIAGGVFSLLSLVFKETFNVLAGVSYSLIIVLDAIVVILAIMLNPRAERRRQQPAESGEMDRESQSRVRSDESSASTAVPSRRHSGISKESSDSPDLEKMSHSDTQVTQLVRCTDEEMVDGTIVSSS